MAREQVFVLLVMLLLVPAVALTAGSSAAGVSAARHDADAALLALAEGEFEASRLLFETALTAGGDLDLCYRYVEVCRAADQLAAGRRFLTDLADASPQQVGPRAALARTVRWQGDCSLWWDHHRRALSLASGEPRLYLEVLQAARECDAGAQPMAFAEGTLDAAATRGLLLVEQDRLPEARTLADSLLALDPGRPLALALDARIHATGHGHEAALAAWVRAAGAGAGAGAEELANWCAAGQASALVFLGRYAEAVAVLDGVVADRAAARDRLGEARALQKRSRALTKAGRYQEALDTSERARRLASGMGDRRLDMVLAEEMGQVWFHLGDFPAAATQMERSRDLASELGDDPHWLQVSNNLATVYAVLGDYDRSDAMYHQVLATYEQRGDSYGQLFSHSGLGFNCIDRGDYLAGLGQLQQALALAEQVDDRGNIHLHRHALGVVYRELGELDLASAHIAAALAMARELDHPGMIAANEAVLGQIDLLEGDLEGGLARSRRAAALYQQIGDQPGLASVYLDLSQAHLAAGRPDSAVIHGRRGAALNRVSGSGLGEGYGLLYTARALLADGRLAAAEAAADSVIELGGELAATQLVWQAEAVLGEVGARREDWPLARRHYALAMAGLEQSQRNLLEEHHKTSFGAGKQGIYEQAIAVEVKAAAAPEAGAAVTFALAERSRARALRDELASAGTSSRAIASAPPELQDEERRLREEIDASMRILWRTDLRPDEREARERELLALQAEHDLIIARCHEQVASRASTVWPRALDTAAVQRTVLTGGDVLLEYFLGEESCWCWVVTPDAVRRVDLPPRETLTALVERSQAWLTRPPGARGDPPPAHAELSRILLAPLPKNQQPSGRIFVVTDGALGLIPFEALREGDRGEGRFLVERAPVVYLPSASTLPLLAARPRVTEPLLVAFACAGGTAKAAPSPPVSVAGRAGATRGRALEPLPFAADEVQGIAATFAGRVEVIAGDRATEGNLKEAALASASVLHLATHALVSAEHPERSGVVLGDDPASRDDGTLWMAEIRDLPLHADLVVLSTCESAVGAAVPGEGVITLARAFLNAGAGSVLASLWSVNDRSTCTWMKCFYAAMAAGQGPPEAARTARLALLLGESPALRHPYYWAPFVLVGKDG